MDAFQDVVVRSLEEVETAASAGTGTEDVSGQETIGAVLVNILLNSIIGFVFLAFFCIARPRLRAIYAPREDPIIMKLSASGGGLRKKKTAEEDTILRPDNDGIFSWVWNTLKVTDEEIFEHHGMDALVYLRFVRVSMFLCIMFAFYALPVLIPINAFGDDNKNNTGLNYVSMAHLKFESPGLYFHMISVYLFSCIFYAMMYSHYRQQVRWRRRYRAKLAPHNHVVMVTEIRKVRVSAIKQYFTKLVPGSEVLSIHMVLRCTELKSIKEKKLAAQARIERALAKYERSGVRPSHKVSGKLPSQVSGYIKFIGDNVDSIQHYQNEIATLDEEIEEKLLQGGGTGADLDSNGEAKATKVAFISFRSLTFASFLAQSQLHKSPWKIRTKLAPEEEDIVWNTLWLGYAEKQGVNWLMRFAVVLLILFWSIPISAVSTFTQVSYLETIPYLSDVLGTAFKIPGAQALLEGFLPSLVLNIFLGVLPYLLRYMSLSQGIPTTSSFEKSITVKYFVFLLFNAFLVYALVGTFTTAAGNSILTTHDSGPESLLQSFKAIMADPSNIPSLLQNALPQQAPNFINYIILQALLIYPMRLTRLPDLIAWVFQLLTLAYSRREKSNAATPGYFLFADNYAVQLLVFTVTMVFSTLQPLILPVSIMYFALAYIVSKYLLVYVNVPMRGGGKSFNILFHSMCFAVIIYQVFMIGMMTIMLPKSAWATYPLPFVTIMFWYFTLRRFKIAAKFGAVDEVAGEVRTLDQCDTHYLQPALIPDLDAAAGLTEEEGFYPQVLEGVGEVDVEGGIDSHELPIKHRSENHESYAVVDDDEESASFERTPLLKQ